MKRPLGIWLTGASSGIGRALALALAAEGHQVLASGRNQDSLQSLANSAGENSAGGRIIPLVFDVTANVDASAMRESITRAIGELDTCIICAGYCEYVDDVLQLDVELFRRVFETNLFGSVRTAGIALPLLAGRVGSENRRGQLLVVSSLSTVAGFPRAEAYGASKAALSYFASSLRIDAAEHGVDVTLVNPGFVKTPMTDRNDFAMPFLLQPEQAAQRILAAVHKRPMVLDFPRRFAWLLRAMSFSKFAWYRLVGPRLSRSSRSTG